MRRLIAVALVVLAAFPLAVAGAQVNASITDVTVSPTNPAPNESTTFTTTIRNLQSSGDAMEIDSVELRDTDGYPVYTRVLNVGTLSPGAEVTVPLTHTFENPGTRNLRVQVDARNVKTDKKVNLRYPVSLTVQDRHPQIEMRADDSVAGVASNGSVTIANGLDASVSNVEVSVSGDDATVLDGRSVFASLKQGEEATADFRFRPQQAGTNELTATITYTLPSGTERTVKQNKTIETEAASDGVVLETSRSGSGTEQTLTVDIINQGNTPAEDVEITGVSENATVSQAAVDAVPAGSRKQVELNTTLSEPRADVIVTADYESATVQRTVNTTASLRSTPGSIELTGLDVTKQEGVLQITGSTSNVGTTTASSVIVRVLPGENVTPTAPNRDFFVGKVPPSDFSSFDLTARATGNVSAIPIEVTYLVGGEQTTKTVSVPIEPGLTGPQKQQEGGGLVGVPFAVVGLGAGVLLAVAGVLIRRRRGGVWTLVPRSQAVVGGSQGVAGLVIPRLRTAVGAFVRGCRDVVEAVVSGFQNTTETLVPRFRTAVSGFQDVVKAAVSRCQRIVGALVGCCQNGAGFLVRRCLEIGLVREDALDRPTDEQIEQDIESAMTVVEDYQTGNDDRDQ